MLVLFFFLNSSYGSFLNGFVDYNTAPLWGAVPLCLLSLFFWLPLSLAVSLWAHSIICSDCGPLLCMLKAQLGSHNPLD